jgi:hypothetical protein
MGYYGILGDYGDVLYGGSWGDREDCWIHLRDIFQETLLQISGFPPRKLSLQPSLESRSKFENP